MFLPLHTRYGGHRNGRTGANVVTVSRGLSMERLLTPGPSQAVCNHSPTGFEWGYAGSGPAQLALAILLDFTQSRDLAERYYQEFKVAYVAEWTEPRWTISGAEIVAWLQHAGAVLVPDDLPGNARR